MLKKLFTIGLCSVIAFSASAQKRSSGGGTVYNNGVGLHVEFGTGGSLVGPQIKHFFNQHSAGQAAILFGTGLTAIDLSYQYHGQIANASGLQWYVGLGPTLGFAKGGGTAFWIRPMAGLDYKISNVPLDLAFDWRPTFQLTPETTDRFTAARFGLGLRFTF